MRTRARTLHQLPTVTTVVVAHHARATAAARLAHTINGHLFMDHGTYGEWANHQRALEWAAQQNTTHVIALQDDAEPIPNFTTHALEAITRQPDTLISFYIGTTRPRAAAVTHATQRAQHANASWLTAPTLYWGVGIAIPTTDITPMLEWSKRSTLPYDQRIGHWYRTQGRTIQYTWPSLIDHHDGPTLVQHADGRPRTKPRRAHQVGTPHWTTKSVPI